MSELHYIIKRNGEKTLFDKRRIFSAIEKAFLSDNLVDPALAMRITDAVVQKIDFSTEQTPKVEAVQDLVEEALMVNNLTTVAKNFILYRERHKQAREEKTLDQIKHNQLTIKKEDGTTTIYDPQIVNDKLTRLSKGIMRVSSPELIDSVNRQIYNNIPEHEITTLTLSASRDRIEHHYDYSQLAARIAANELYEDVLGTGFGKNDFKAAYQDQFEAFIQQGLDSDMLDPRLGDYDFEKLKAAIKPEKDDLFYYLGLQILIDRYLLRDRTAKKSVFELPQWFWMRVSMGLATNEANKEERAIEFYNVLSSMDLVSSTPTLFNSGTQHSQMSSCYINIVDDSLEHIFKVYSDNAMLSKWAGGIGTDWTPIRATGSKIKGTNGESQGVIPFIKIFNDVALAVNQGGKRKGAMCGYMEVWHADFEQFLELKKNTGDERRRAHDINTACWIPDLFMKRVQNGGNWTYFCPSDTPDLHDLYGKAFEERYEYYESQDLPSKRTIKASDLWRKMLTMLYETGHPWLTFKDTINVRNPQSHVGVVHSSNLCTEITLNTSPEETAVCNLASVNLANFIEDGKINQEKLERVITTGIRMLDNVIDNNFYPTAEAKAANLKHRAIGLGLMGYQDALYKLNHRFDSQSAIDFADESMEMISYYAILASSKLAKERGSYETFKGSKWSNGILPYDTIEMLEKERGQTLTVDKAQRMDWAPVKAHIQEHGMRNCNTMAIAPTATIANISGVYPCTEPAFKNIYMKENLSGNFLVINRHLIDRLDELGLWTSAMIDKIKLNDGSIRNIANIPEEIRDVFKEVFEIESKWILQAAARRAKWIDQSASTNVFISTTSGKLLSDTYQMAWNLGLKTTYYLRTLGASQIQKASVAETADTAPISAEATEVKVCSIEDPTCEVCQ